MTLDELKNELGKYLETNGSHALDFESDFHSVRSYVIDEIVSWLEYHSPENVKARLTKTIQNKQVVDNFFESIK